MVTKCDAVASKCSLPASHLLNDGWIEIEATFVIGA